MKQYRVEVKNSSEAKEAQDLFEKLGYRKGACFKDNFPKLIITEEEGDSCGASTHYKGGVLITLDQLRTMAKKEYLNANYELITVSREHPVCADWIEVPDGAEMLVYFKEYDNANFYKSGFSEIWQNDCWDDDMSDHIEYCKKEGVVLWQRTPSVDNIETYTRENNHYFIDVSDVDEIDFYEIAKRYKVTDPAVQHILKKCLAVGSRGHKDLETDLKDILKTAKRALAINGFS